MVRESCCCAVVFPTRLRAAQPPGPSMPPPCSAGGRGGRLSLETGLTGGESEGSVVQVPNSAVSSCSRCAPLPFSCQLRSVVHLCSASLPPLKPPLGSPSLSLSLAFDVSDRHMVAGLSAPLLVHLPLFAMAAVPEGQSGLKGEMSPPLTHSYIFQASLL